MNIALENVSYAPPTQAPTATPMSLTDFFHTSVVSSLNISAVPTQLSVTKNAYIYNIGEESDNLYCIVKGRIKVGVYAHDSKKIIKYILEAGDIFGELAIVGEIIHVDFAQAMEDTQIQVLPLYSVKELMQKSHNFNRQIMETIGKRLVQTQQRLELLVFKDARSRIITFLRDLAIGRGRTVGYELLVQKFFTHQEIANLTDTSRQTVTTVLNELREDNYIYFDRKRLLVRDIQKLSKLIM